MNLALECLFVVFEDENRINSLNIDLDQRHINCMFIQWHMLKDFIERERQKAAYQKEYV